MTAVSIHAVSKSFGSLKAINQVSLDIAEGEFFGLLGPNGAGKTTLISCLAGLAKPDSGKIAILGSDVFEDYRGARRKLGVVPQELLFDPFFTARETLRLQSGYFGIQNNDDWIDEILHHLDLTDKANTNMRRLSGGMKRRVLVAQALVHKPPVIVLDEPTAGVDVALRQGLWKFIRRLNKDGHTIILTTHYLEEAEELCSRVAMMQAGKIVALDTTQNLLSQFAHQNISVLVDQPEKMPEALKNRAQAPVLHNDLWHFPIKEATEIEPLLAEIRASGLLLKDFSLSKTDLEDVFMMVMQKRSGAKSSPQGAAQ